MLEQIHQQVRRCLTDAREGLDRLVNALLHEETIGTGQLVQILGPRPKPEGVQFTDGELIGSPSPK